MAPLSVVAVVLLGLVGCGGDERGVREEKPRALPDGGRCVRESGGDQEPRAFDADVLVEGGTTKPGHSIEVTVCFVPGRAGRALLSLTADGGVVPREQRLEVPGLAAGVRQVRRVRVDVPANARGTLTGTVQLYDDAGVERGTFRDVVYLGGGPDAVFVSHTSLSRVDVAAVEHEYDKDRITRGEYRDRIDRLRNPQPVTTPSEVTRS